MAIPDTLLIEGTDVENFGCVEWLSNWPFLMPNQRGELPEYPGVDGATFVDQPWSTQVLPIPMALAAGPGVCEETDEEQVAGANKRYRDLRAACKPGQLVTLTRRVSLPGVTEEHTVPAKFLTMTPERLALSVMKTVVEFELLDLWHGATVEIASAAGTHDIDGEVRTHSMQITLPEGVARTITNTTTGHWLTFSTGTPVGGTIVDVEARTATNIVSGADVSQYLSWGKTFPFRLNPGSNTITVSAVGASIDYQPAYL